LSAPINCHCGLCRRLSGAAFTTWFSVQKAALSGQGEETMTAYRPTPNLTRHFCATCGTHVYTLDDRYPDVKGICAGAFDGVTLPAPRAEYFVDDKASWFELPHGATCFGGPTGFEPVNN
jgi:hypothetical protein